MRCYFHLVNSHEIIPDDEGIDVPDLEAMQCLALQTIHEIRNAGNHADEDWRGWRLDVVCPAGSVLLSISLDTTLQ